MQGGNNVPTNGLAQRAFIAHAVGRVALSLVVRRGCMARLGTQAVGETAPVGAVVGLLKPASQAGVGEILVVRRQAVVGRGLAIRLRGPATLAPVTCRGNPGRHHSAHHHSPIEGALTGSGSGDGCGDVSTEVSGGSCAHGVRLGCHAIVERKCTPLLEAPVDAHLSTTSINHQDCEQELGLRNTTKHHLHTCSRLAML